MRDEGGSRVDVEVAGTGGETAGGEGVKIKTVLVTAQTGCIIKYLDDAVMTQTGFYEEKKKNTLN